MYSAVPRDWTRGRRHGSSVGRRRGGGSPSGGDPGTGTRPTSLRRVPRSPTALGILIMPQDGPF